MTRSNGTEKEHEPDVSQAETCSADQQLQLLEQNDTERNIKSRHAQMIAIDTASSLVLAKPSQLEACLASCLLPDVSPGPWYCHSSDRTRLLSPHLWSLNRILLESLCLVASWFRHRLALFLLVWHYRSLLTRGSEYSHQLLTQ